MNPTSRRRGEAFQEACELLVVPRGGAGVVELGPGASTADVEGVSAEVSSTAVRRALARRRARLGGARGGAEGGARGGVDGGRESGEGEEGSGEGEEALHALHPDVLRYIDAHDLYASGAS